MQIRGVIHTAAQTHQTPASHSECPGVSRVCQRATDRVETAAVQQQLRSDASNQLSRAEYSLPESSQQLRRRLCRGQNSNGILQQFQNLQLDRRQLPLCARMERVSHNEDDLSSSRTRASTPSVSEYHPVHLDQSVSDCLTGSLFARIPTQCTSTLSVSDWLVCASLFVVVCCLYLPISWCLCLADLS